MTNSYRGRFAPSPTGPLHTGSLLAACASWADARAAGGQWLVRMEDLDPPREQPGADRLILDVLAAAGLVSDEPVLYQSERHAAYAAALESLLAAGLAFECRCSRSELAARGGIHRGVCSADPGVRSRAAAIRLKVADVDIEFVDRIQGRYRQNLLRDVGDFVLRRADGPWAYQLAVVVDDAHQRITDIVRGSDLIDSTPRQIHLQRCLGLPTPRYAHVPVLTGDDGHKLSKQNLAPAVAAEEMAAQLAEIAELLGQQPLSPGPPGQQLRELARQWNIEQVPRRMAIARQRDPAVPAGSIGPR
jgi:glutamyl-Q tRNA(Asp) synthetase